MKFIKYISLIFIAGGVLFVSFGVWGLIDTNKQTAHSLEQAKRAISNPVKADELRKEEGKRFEPPFGDAVGILELSTLSAELPIVEGTDPDDLKKGVGHYKGSYYPNENGQIVLSGHRDTVFRRTNELKIGDSIKIKLPYGQFEYEITNTKIVDRLDTSIITLQHEKEELILTTCYPFNYVGNAPKRYIIYAEKMNK
ncbi:class D sortase [Bacillus sp. 03113]|uniref:class D sortase n=1 Tax=Bacillus sp. 03113 TaxID=2578211 RepID=UPI0011413F04|nr:class D sortase [Bacillus sp. 03113]